MLYEKFYGFALTVCIRYAYNVNEAVEAVNDGFVKVFKGIDHFVVPAEDPLLEKLFMGWLKKIMINTGINYSKFSKKESSWAITKNMAYAEDHTGQPDADTLAYGDLVKLIQKLSPAYRNTFCLHVIDGYKHEEISEMLGISVGTSKSNLLKARKSLRKMLEKIEAQEV